jgi:phage terminase small subunit
MARKKSAVLTDRQAAFVESILDGKTAAQAGRDAGYAPRGSARLATNQLVQDEIKTGQSELQKTTLITRAQVVDGILEAIERAKIQSEPATEIKGWVEIAKMHGYDKPDDAQRRELSAKAKDLQTRLMNMSTQDLLEMAAGNMYIDGDAERVDD